VFHPPKSSEQSEKYYIKRIIGLPGETLKLINGEVHIINQSNPNGFKVNEPYLNSENRNNTQIQQFGLDTFQIPENRYFVMGDNRNSSTDSRSCFQPKFSSKCDDGSSFLSMDQIEGKAWVSLWPISKIRVIEHAPKTDKY
jgi:signal peptidase I